MPPGLNVFIDVGTDIGDERPEWFFHGKPPAGPGAFVITMETGITIQAPLFIKTGEKIKIATRTGKYMERA